MLRLFSVSHDGISRESDVGLVAVCLSELDLLRPCGSSSVSQPAPLIMNYTCDLAVCKNLEPSLIYRQYMVAIPAILEAAEESKFCASFLEPNETLTMTVSLKSKELNTTLMQMVSREEFHVCRDFEVKCRVELLHVCRIPPECV